MKTVKRADYNGTEGKDSYTIDDVEQEPIIHDAKEMDIFINASPAKDYSISVIYYDEDGNKYQ